MLIDTQQAADRLKEAGAGDDLAWAIVDVLKMSEERVATKHDLDLMKRDLELMEERLTSKMNRSVRNWVAGGTGLIALLMTLFEFNT